MSNFNIYTVIGIMSGTSMDGVDFSLIKTDGVSNTEIIHEKQYKYPDKYRNKLKSIIDNLPKSQKNQTTYAKKNEKLITNEFLFYIKKFLKHIKPNLYKIELIGFSGQTIYHNPIKRYSIQLGSGKEIYKEINIPTISNFRQKDLLNGGQGAPIGSFYHKSIINKIKEKSCIINLGGISNITFTNKKKLISYDLGPANSLIDDLSDFFYKKNFDKDGSYASKGKKIDHILLEFNQDLYFKKNYPKSLDRNYFNIFFKKLIKYKANDALHTASMMTVFSIINGLKLLKYKIEIIILTGGGRKNLFIKRQQKKKLRLKKIKITNIENYGFNGDMLESQMFGYLAVRSIKKLPLSTPSTTGVISSITGGVRNGKLIKY